MFALQGSVLVILVPIQDRQSPDALIFRGGAPTGRVPADALQTLPETESGNQDSQVATEHFTKWPEASPRKSRGCDSSRAPRERILHHIWAPG